jgi:hypothetical protein
MPDHNGEGLMMKGISIPIGGQGGKLATVSGEDQLRKIIILNLSDCESANPFQDLGIGAQVIFDASSPATQGVIRSRIMQVFKRLERQGRASLAQGYPTFSADRDNGQLIAEIRYINLETTSEEELAIGYATAMGGVATVGGI